MRADPDKKSRPKRGLLGNLGRIFSGRQNRRQANQQDQEMNAPRGGRRMNVPILPDRDEDEREEMGYVVNSEWDEELIRKAKERQELADLLLYESSEMPSDFSELQERINAAAREAEARPIEEQRVGKDKEEAE